MHRASSLRARPNLLVESKAGGAIGARAHDLVFSGNDDGQAIDLDTLGDKSITTRNRFLEWAAIVDAVA